MYWLYIILCLSVKYILFSFTTKFHFLIFQTLEFFAINQDLNGILKDYFPPIVNHIISWMFYGLSPNNISYDTFVNDFKLIYSIIVISIIILVFFIYYGFYSLYIYLKNRKNEINYKKIILKIFLLSFLPLTVLSIKNIILLQSISFIRSFIAILTISILTIGLPAIIFNIIYGSKKFSLRRQFFFLLDPFVKKFKYMVSIVFTSIIRSTDSNCYSFF